MQRLTEKREISLVMSQWGGTSKELRIYNRLAEFEDFMEEQRFESLEEVKRQCDLVVDFLAMDSENTQIKIANKKLYKENQKLKDRWQELKNWIVNTNPLIGQNIYFLHEALLRKMKELEKDN